MMNGDVSLKESYESKNITEILLIALLTETKVSNISSVEWIAWSSEYMLFKQGAIGSYSAVHTVWVVPGIYHA